MFCPYSRFMVPIKISRPQLISFEAGCGGIYQFFVGLLFDFIFRVFFIQFVQFLCFLYGQIVIFPIDLELHGIQNDIIPEIIRADC
jgi:hypothetical protein